MRQPELGVPRGRNRPDRGGLRIGFAGFYETSVGDQDPPVYPPSYPARRVLDLIADKWTPIILYCLSGGTRRFSQLQHQIPDISKKMLIQVLRRLEADGLVLRTVYPVVPPKTEYSLTDLGHQIHEPVALLCAWAREHEKEIEGIFQKRSQTA